jgi:WD40 repeat protein
MRISSWIAAAAALLGVVACGPARQRSMHVLDVGAVVYSLAFSPDGRTLACATQGRILLVDAESGTRLRELGPLQKQCLSVAFSRGRLLSAGGDGYARLWDLERGAEVKSVKTGVVCNLAVSPDGRWLATTPAFDGHDCRIEGAATVTIWDLDRGRQSSPIPGSRCAVQALAIGASGLVAVSYRGPRIDIRDVRTGNLLRSLQEEGSDPEPITSLAFGLEAPNLLAAGDNVGGITLWDAIEGRLLVHRFYAACDNFFGPSNPMKAMAFAAHGLFAAAASCKVAETWRFGVRPEQGRRAMARLVDTGPDGSQTIEALAVNRDGSLIAMSYNDEKIRIWRGPSGS